MPNRARGRQGLILIRPSSWEAELLLSLCFLFLYTWASSAFFKWMVAAKGYLHRICIFTYIWSIKDWKSITENWEATSWGNLCPLIKLNPESHLLLVPLVWTPLCLQAELLCPLMLRSKHGPKFLSSFFPCGVETRWDFQKVLQSSKHKVKGKIETARHMKASKLIHNSSHPPQQTCPSHSEEELVGQQRMKCLTAHAWGTARPSHSSRHPKG